MNPDADYLYSIHDHSKILMMYHCEIKKTSDTALTDIEAIKNYISARYAKKTNLRFKRDNIELFDSIKLLND